MPESDNDIKGIVSDVRELKDGQRLLETHITSLLVTMARQEERQAETTKKLDLLTITIANNYVSAIEFGDLKKRVDKLEGWLTWILRLAAGALVLAGMAALRIKGGI